MFSSPIGPVGIGCAIVSAWVFAENPIWRALWMIAFLAWCGWVAWVAMRTQNWVLLTIPGGMFAIGAVVAGIKRSLAPED